MIDLSRIRSLKKLEEIKKDLEEFLSNPVIKELYSTEEDFQEDSYEDDAEQTKMLLENVKRRITSLAKFVRKQEKKLTSGEEKV